jgi:hypothetical protein
VLNQGNMRALTCVRVEIAGSEGRHYSVAVDNGAAVVPRSVLGEMGLANFV